MILKIYRITKEDIVYIAIPHRWTALLNNEFKWYFEGDTLLNKLYQERSFKIGEYLDTEQWFVMDYGDADYFHRKGITVKIQKVFY